MVGVAQLVRASGCGPEGRGFKSHHSPKFFRISRCPPSSQKSGLRRINSPDIIDIGINSVPPVYFVLRWINRLAHPAHAVSEGSELTVQAF